MLNKVILMGRITKDLELKTTQSGTAVLSFSIAVDRNYAKQGEERETDFINCVAWRQRAEFINNYFSKGRMIAVEGSLQTRTYDDNNGVTRYVTEVVVDNVSFTGEPKLASQTAAQPETTYQPTTGRAPQVAEAISTAEMEEVITDDGVPF